MIDEKGRDIAKKISRFKFVFDRQKGYLGIMNSILLLNLFFDKYEFKWYYIFIFILWGFWAWFDAKYVSNEEINFIHNKSKFLKKIGEQK